MESDGPNPDEPDPEAWPSPPEPSKRRRPVVTGIIVGAVATFAILAVIGYLVAPTDSETPLEEDFSSDDPEFTTDSDPFVDFSVSDGAYHILIKDSSRPQLARHLRPYLRRV